VRALDVVGINCFLTLFLKKVLGKFHIKAVSTLGGFILSSRAHVAVSPIDPLHFWEGL
jgi:hypothetical protein